MLKRWKELVEHFVKKAEKETKENKQQFVSWSFYSHERVWTYNEKQFVNWLKKNVVQRKDGKLVQRVVIEVMRPVNISGIELVPNPYKEKKTKKRKAKKGPK